MISPIEYYTAGENLYAKVLNSVCEKYDLTSMELTIIMFLANNPQMDTATQIVKHRGLTKSYVSISVRSLLERGLLKGEYQNGNHRTIHLILTDQAKPIITDGSNAEKKFLEILFDGFTKEELKILDSLMGRIYENIRESKVKNE